MDDCEIIELFWQRDETAIERTEMEYGCKLYALAMNILRCQEDAEEAVNDTYLSAWNSIPPQKPRHLFAFLAKICRYKAYGKLDFKTAKKRQAQIVELTVEMESCIPAPSEENVDGEEIGQILNSFLADLAEEKRLIFIRRYWYGDSVSEISKRYGIGESKVKVSLMRTRNELKKYLKKEGVGV